MKSKIIVLIFLLGLKFCKAQCKYFLNFKTFFRKIVCSNYWMLLLEHYKSKSVKHYIEKIKFEIMKHFCAFQFIPGRGTGIQQLVRPFILTQFTTCLMFRPTDKMATKTLPIIRIQHLRLHTSTMASAQISRLH